MYSITLNTNAIIRPKDNGIHSKGFLFSSQDWNRKQRFWKNYISLQMLHSHTTSYKERY